MFNFQAAVVKDKTSREPAAENDVKSNNIILPVILAVMM